MTSRSSSLRFPFRAALLAGVALLAFGVAADDRDLFRSASSSPYVFFVLDTSGSMVWRTHTDSQAEGGMDDPESKLYQAKRALYEVLRSAGNDIEVGFAHFDTGDTWVRRKFHLYTPAAVPPWSSHSDLDEILRPGTPVIFGEAKDNWDDNASGDQSYESYRGYSWLRYGSCGDEFGDEDEIHDFPKLGADGELDTYFYFENGGDEYRIKFNDLPAGQDLGDASVDVRVTIWERTGRCRDEDDELDGDYAQRYDEVIRFVPFLEEDEIDPSIPFQPHPDFFSRDDGRFEFDLYSYYSRSSCGTGGWDGNFDDDLTDGWNETYDRQADPLGRGDALSRGDVVPWDWERPWGTSNLQEVLYRLAPNLSPCRHEPSDPDFAFCETVPDFRLARYYQNERSGNTLPLLPQYEDYPPLFSFHSTPLAGSMDSFKAWYDLWKVAAARAESGDPRFECRQKYLVILSDGRDTCPGDECVAAGGVYDGGNGPRVFIVGYALSGADQDAMQCIADNGGTGRDLDADGVPEGPGPIFVDTPQDLVDALNEVLISIQSEATTVSAAAVPTVQADVADKVYLTDFTPIGDAAVWPGRLQNFVKPVPFDADGNPDVSRRCSGDDDSGCLAWEAQEVVVANQYDDDDPVGEGARQRRIYYSELREAVLGVGGEPVASGGAVPAARHYWVPIDPEEVGDEIPVAVAADLVRGHAAPPTGAGLEQVNGVISQHLTMRVETLPDGTTSRYLLGDFFHSDPLLLDAPANPVYYLQDLEGDPAVDCEQGDPDSYRCFALRHKSRRKLIVLGSNDGMLHVFDAGNFHLDDAPNPANEGSYDLGTGREVFAYVPRAVMPTISDLVLREPPRHEYTVDGPPVAADVFIDPIHGGLGSGDPPKAEDREWRSVVMSGLRRGGAVSADLVEPAVVDAARPQIASGYFLLDLTQPDRILALDSFGDKFPDSDEAPDTWVPDVADVDQPPVCLGTAEAEVPEGCGPLAFGSPRWEFNDTLSGTTEEGDVVVGVRLDEDDDGWVDLGPTWSRPFIGRLQICTGSACDPEAEAEEDRADLEDRYVAAFGGGHDPQAPVDRGSHFYLVDIETGTTIYKRKVDGAVASQPVVLENRSGYLEKIYFGTTLGFLYRIDLRPTILGSDRIPRLEAVTLSEEVDGLASPVTARVDRIRDDLYRPVLLFNANSGTVEEVLSGTVEPRPIFLPPAVFFLLERQLNALSFGTGDREDIFAVDGPTGRLITFVDPYDSEALQALTEPLDVEDLREVTTDLDAGDLLTDEGDRGWWIELRPDERAVGSPFVLSGVLFFSTFEPRDLPEVDDGICQQRGTARAYGLLATGGEPILIEGGARTRFVVEAGLVTEPFAVQYQTKNKPQPGTGGTGLTTDQEEILRQLQELYPENCRFPPGARIDIFIRKASTGLRLVAPVPQCVVQAGFQEE